MTKRSDIIDGSSANAAKYGLIYTKKCGWVDLGHANPAGAEDLWNKVKSEVNENGTKSGYYRISYSQKMGNKHLKVGVRKVYDIKKGNSLANKKSIALTIFLDVSKEFETMQGNWLFSKFTNSSFSAEDLVSNLIGFYRAVEPNKEYISICEPVSKNIALAIWDKYGAVGDNKNTTTIPYIYPLPDSSRAKTLRTPLPLAFNSITPVKQGVLFREVK
ncbi:DUF4056 domain-containing protein [Pseudoalteromonas agarivorans]|uniref:DUF4056 domain-containing protein n=1 Tax=Pseudoalteromonas agarivorans TaxID=176102 RepID=UPI00311FA576